MGLRIKIGFQVVNKMIILIWVACFNLVEFRNDVCYKAIIILETTRKNPNFSFIWPMPAKIRQISQK